MSDEIKAKKLTKKVSAGRVKPKRADEIPKELSDIKASPEYQQAFTDGINSFNSKWEGWEVSAVHEFGSELNQLRPLLEAHLEDVFGRKFRIRFASQRHFGDCAAENYKMMYVSDFPNNQYNKPTWSDSIATRMKMYNAEDGTIRWGSRRELYLHIIPREIWEAEDLVRTEAREARKRKHGLGKKDHEDERGNYSDTEEEEVAARDYFN